MDPGWRVSAYVGRSCMDAMPPLDYENRAFPEVQWLRDAAPYVDDPAMRCFASRLKRRVPLKVAVFGTSVVAGNRCNKQNGANFPQLLMQLLSRRYPGGNLTLSAFGYPGASAVFMRSCSDTLLPTPDADLYIIEMIDNLSSDYHGFGREVEMLMDAIRQRSPGAAIMLLSPMLQSCTRGLKIPRWKPYHKVPLDAEGTREILRTCYRNDTIAAAFEELGPAHGITVVSIRNMVRRRLWANPDDASRLIGKRVADAVHPTGFGHWEYAVAIEHAIGQQQSGEAWSAVDAQACQKGCDTTAATCTVPRWPTLALKNMFAPRSSTSSATRATICAFGEALRPYVLRTTGFEYQIDYNKQGLPKPGYRATTAGAELDLCYEPEPPSASKLERSAGASGVAKVKSAWSLAYLMSYERMGVARGECLAKRSGSFCSCPPREFDAHWRRQVSQPHISRLQTILRYARNPTTGVWGPAGRERAHATREHDPSFYTSPRADGMRPCGCVIRLTVLNRSSSAGQGHQFKLTSLMSGFYTGNLVGQAAEWAANYDLI